MSEPSAVDGMPQFAFDPTAIIIYGGGGHGKTLIELVRAMGVYRVAGIVEGNPSDPMMPRMINIPRNSDVVEGDTIVTSGFGGIYPKGLIVGTVGDVQNDSGGLLKIAILEPAVDFQKLEDVAVIVASREAPPAPLTPPQQTPGTETPVGDNAAAGAEP